MQKLMETVMETVVIKPALLALMILAAQVTSYPHLRSYDKPQQRQNYNFQTRLTRHFQENDVLDRAESSLVSGLFVVSAFHSGGARKVDRYCMMYPEECALDPSTVSYELGYCVPDPLGQSTAVKVLADSKGNIVLTSFSDNICSTAVKRSHVNIDSVQYGEKNDIKVEIRAVEEPSSTAEHLVKKYYFDETCSGPYSKMEVGSYAEHDVRVGVCWNNPYTGRSYITTYVTSESADYVTKNHISRGIKEVCAFEGSDCGGCTFAEDSECDAAYSCYGSGLTALKSTLPGNNQCLKEGNHYVLSLFGGGTYDELSPKEPTSTPTGQPFWLPEPFWHSKPAF
jgi:hypothetical protein